MSFTRRGWIGAALAALASLSGFAPAAAARPPIRRRPRPDGRKPYKTRWIGHY